MPAVSVVIPHFRAANTLPATLTSVLAQTVEDIEIIIVDDGSDHVCRKQMITSAARDRRVQIILQANHGVSVARNAGILRAAAPLVAFMDADDLWSRDHLALHLERFNRSPALDLSFSSARFIDETGQVVGRSRPNAAFQTAAALLMSNPTTTTSSWVVRATAFARAGLFDARLRYNEDQDWLVRASLAGLQIQGTDAYTVDYRTAATGLAGNLERMRAGYLVMLNGLRARTPALVEAVGREGIARQDRFLARQALRLGLPRATARRYIINAIRGAPLLALKEPRQTFGTCLAAILPGSTHVR